MENVDQNTLTTPPETQTDHHDVVDLLTNFFEKQKQWLSTQNPKIKDVAAILKIRNRTKNLSLSLKSWGSQLSTHNASSLETDPFSIKRDMLEFFNFLQRSCVPVDKSPSEILIESSNYCVSFQNNSRSLLCFAAHFFDEINLERMLQKIFSFYIHQNLEEMIVCLFWIILRIDDSPEWKSKVENCFEKQLDVTFRSFEKVFFGGDSNFKDESFNLKMSDVFEEGFFAEQIGVSIQKGIPKFIQFIETILQLWYLFPLQIKSIVMTHLPEIFELINHQLNNTFVDTETMSIKNIKGKKIFE